MVALRRESPFTHMPSTTEPISIVIPSFRRVHNLLISIGQLLCHEPMKRNASEVLIAHGSIASYAQRERINEQAFLLCMNIAASRVGEVSPVRDCNLSRVRHLDMSQEHPRHFTATRFLAAERAHNRVILQLDDDLVPGEAMLQALIDAVALEHGFPHYEHEVQVQSSPVQSSPVESSQVRASQGKSSQAMVRHGKSRHPGMHGPSGFAKRWYGAHGYKKPHSTTYHLPLTTQHLTPTTYHLPPTTCHLPPTTPHLPLNTYHE